MWKDLAKISPDPLKVYRKVFRKANPNGEVRRNQEADDGMSREEKEEKSKPIWTWLSALLLGSAMVARGEIGLLIIEIGYNSTPYVSEEGFITGVWAILLNTIIGPITVGILVKLYGKKIGESEWGVQGTTSQSVPGRHEHEEEHAVV